MKFPAIFCLLCLFSTLTLTSSPDSTAIKDLTTALELIKEGKKAEAESYICEGMLVLQREDDLENWLNWHRLLGRAWRKSDPPRPYDALEVFQEGLDGMWRRPNIEKEHERLAMLYMDMGHTYGNYTGNYLSKRDFYLHASQIFLDTLKQEDFWIAKYVLVNLGNAYTRLNDFENAKYYLEKVKTICATEEEWDFWAITCSNLGLMYNRKNEYKEALNCFKEALVRQDSLDFWTRNDLFANTGLIYNQLKDYENALKFTNMAQAEINQIKDAPSKKDGQYQLHLNYGRTYKDLGVLEKSTNNHKQAAFFFSKAENNFEAAIRLLSPYESRAHAFQNIYLGNP